jgi:hypothetical protein
MLKGECQGLPVFSPSIVNTVNPPQPKQIEMPSTCPTFSSLARFYRNHCLWSHCGTASRHKHKYYYNRKAKSHSEKAAYRLNRHKLSIHFNCQYSFRRFEWCHGFRRDENTSSSTLPPPSPQQTLIASSTISNMEKNEWIPPINAESLEELSLPHLFKSLQLRHDLLSDPNLCFRPNLDGPSGREKRKKADRYWKRVDSVIKADEPIKCIKVIVGELVTILESLVDPFKSISVRKFHWEWPLYISSSDIRDMFDPDLILQQLAHNCLSIDKQIDILRLIFDSMCPDQHQIRIELMRRYFREHRYAKALDQCFKLLEIIKLVSKNLVYFFFVKSPP